MNSQHILLIDDHAVFRLGLRMLLRKAFPALRVSEAESLEQAMAPTAQRPTQIPDQPQGLAPNLVLLDIKLPGLNGIEGIALLKERWPDTRVVILSSLESPEAMGEALGYGAAGYLSKGESADDLLDKILGFIQGGCESPAEADTLLGRLTPRQRETLKLLCRGLSNKLIAKQLELAENTVRRHVQDILDYFQVESRSEAVFAARRRGLVE